MQDTKTINFAEALSKQAMANSKQSVHLMGATNTTMNATFVADPKAGTNQIPPENAHHHVLKLLRIEIAINLHNILSAEVNGVADRDYKDMLGLIDKLKTVLDSSNTQFMADAKARIKQSRDQLADVIGTNAVHMDSGNNVEILSANDIRVLKSVLWRAGTAMRWEAPLIVDNAHTRVLLAHTMLQEADLLAQRAQNILTQVREEYGISAKNIALIAEKKLHVSADTVDVAAKTDIHVHADGSVTVTTANTKDIVVKSGGKLTLVGTSVDINPTSTPSVTDPSGVEDTARPERRSKGKKHLEIPQWQGMSPLPAYVTLEDEVQLQKDTESAGE